MTRSAEALKRRAEKRNISLEDMKQVESERIFKKSKGESEKEKVIGEKQKGKTTKTPPPSKKHRPEKTPSSLPSSAPVSVAPPPSVPKESQKPPTERWICSACNNSNLIRFSQTVCNRCQRLRSEVEKKVEESPQNQVETPMVPVTVENEKVNQVSEDKETPKKLKKNKHSKPREDKPAPVWTCGVASQEKIDENMRLRNLYNNLETRSQLTEEELERAKILVERSERKKQKKELAKSSRNRHSRK